MRCVSEWVHIRMYMYMLVYVLCMSKKQLNIEKYREILDNPSRQLTFKINNRNTRTRCEICSKLTIKTPERLQLRHSGVFIVTFEHIHALL